MSADAAWYCDKCKDGPYSWVYQPICPACGHKRCDICHIDYSQELVPRISLQTAVKENDMDMVLQLLDNGADVNATDSSFHTPLHVAIKHGFFSITRLLLEKGADVNAKVRRSKTPLRLAIEHGFFDITRLLLEKGADINTKDRRLEEYLRLAIEHGSFDITRLLLEKGADINTKDHRLKTSLHLAVEHEFLDITRLLLEKGADVDSKDWNSRTPLHVASKHGVFDTIRLLLDEGADINARDSSNNTPLHIAICDGFDPIYYRILQRSVIDMRSSEAETSLRIAAEHQHLNLIFNLIRAGADINARNSKSQTPLLFAISYSSSTIMAALIEAGADVNIPRVDGETALTVSLKKGRYDEVETLLEAGAMQKGAFQDSISIFHESYPGKVELIVEWSVLHFVRSELSGNVDDLLKVVTLTGSVRNAQMMSVEDYVAQTWGDSGLKVLRALIEMMRKGYSRLDVSAGQIVTFDGHGEDSLKIALETSKEHILDIMEQIAWFGCVFACAKTNSENRGPLLATGYYSFSSTSECFHLLVQKYSPENNLDELCWTKILRNATLAVGFPVRKRSEGVGLEIPFPLLLRFADISVSIEHDSGTVLIGDSLILFPSRKLGDGVQWHITYATSAQYAIQVLDRTPDWIRTDDIGQLAQLRAYLGYCSHAQILLGTRGLIMSQHAVELQSSLPKSQSQIELVHEGTMSAGFSIRGIFNTTVGGKWIVPTRLSVPFDGNRDLEDLLMNAHRRPVLVYDCNEDRGWLVPELNLVFHMALTYLHRTDVRQRCLACVQETLPYLSATVGGGSEAYNVVIEHWNLKLYEKIEDSQMKTFGMVIRDFMKDLRKLRTAENVRRESKGSNLSLFSGRTLRGWDFSELASKAENIFQREMKWENGSGPMWSMLGDTEDMLVILGSAFGSLICPDLDRTKVASGWENIPKGAGLLTATNSCVKQLAQKQVLVTLSEMKASNKRGGDLFWYRPATFHADCNRYCNQSCLVIHEIARRRTQTCTDVQDPRTLREDGAVVFGCASIYHKSLKKEFGH